MIGIARYSCISENCRTNPSTACPKFEETRMHVGPIFHRVIRKTAAYPSNSEDKWCNKPTRRCMESSSHYWHCVTIITFYQDVQHLVDAVAGILCGSHCQPTESSYIITLMMSLLQKYKPILGQRLGLEYANRSDMSSQEINREYVSLQTPKAW